MLRPVVALLTAALLAGAVLAHAADPAKVLRLAISDIDTLDPHQLQDKYSRDAAQLVYEGMYEWHYLDRPPGPAPRTASGMPAISADGKTWTIRLQPGIRFTPDPAFGGTPRELVAEDYVYSIKRYCDPNLRGGGDPEVTDLIVGMRAVVDAARKPGAKFDYDARVEGLRAIDRYTLQLTFTDEQYAVALGLLVIEAVAREVVEAAKGDIQARAVGTGPYRLKEWQRGSRLVFEANPDYRTLQFPATTNPEAAPIAAAMKGRKLPAIGRIEAQIIDEQNVRVLEFDRGAVDVIELRGEAVGPLLVNDVLAPSLAARGITRIVYATNSVRSLYVNMDDPVVGGMDRTRTALRRAIALGIDVATLKRVVYQGQALPTNQIVAPGIAGFDPDAPPRPYDPATAAALLDRLGYDRRDAQGMRLAPDGKPLTVVLTIFTGTVWREIQTLLKKNMDALGVRLDFRAVPVQDLFKATAQGQFALAIHGRAANPNGLIFQTFYGPMPPEANESRFRYAPYDHAYRDFVRARDDSTRLRAARTMTAILQGYAPVIPLLVDVQNAFVQPWLLGYYPSPFSAYVQYMDIDLAKRPR